jgi:hypothetical protein
MNTIGEMVGRDFVHILPRPPPFRNISFINQRFLKEKRGSQGVEGNPSDKRVDVCTHIPRVRIPSPALPELVIV